MEEKLFRYFIDESPPEERAEIEQLLKEDEKAGEYLSYLESIWMNYREKKSDWDVDEAWQRFSQTAGIDSARSMKNDKTAGRGSYKSERRYRNRELKSLNSYKVAAIIFGVAFLSLIFVWNSDVFNKGIVENIPDKHIQTKKGQHTRITLTDGSKVLLNAESKLIFPEQFSGGSRELFLEGEAYFEVVNDADRIFRVYTESTVIEVLGTSFNINARVSDTGEVKVVVSDGVVSLSGKEAVEPQEVIINKGMMGTWREDGGITSPVNADLRKALGWMRGELIFDGTPLKDVITHLSRQYNIIIFVEDESILTRRLTANYKAETIDDIIRNIALTINITYRKENDNFYILK